MSILRSRAQQRCDMENNGLISTAEWNAIISEQYGDLHSIVSSAGGRYFETIDTISTTGATSYDEPEDHLGTVAVTRVIDSAGRRYDLTEIMAQERARWSGLTGTAQVFALIDDKLYLYPTPPTGQTYELLYIPQPPDLTDYADSDVIDVVNTYGEAFLLWGAAVYGHNKGETDPALAISMRDKAEAKLLDWATMRAFNGPRPRIAIDDDTGSMPSDASDWRYR